MGRLPSVFLRKHWIRRAVKSQTNPCMERDDTLIALVTLMPALLYNFCCYIYIIHFRNRYILLNTAVSSKWGFPAPCDTDTCGMNFSFEFFLCVCLSPSMIQWFHHNQHVWLVLDLACYRHTMRMTGCNCWDARDAAVCLTFSGAAALNTFTCTPSSHFIYLPFEV